MKVLTKLTYKKETLNSSASQYKTQNDVIIMKTLL